MTWRYDLLESKLRIKYHYRHATVKVSRISKLAKRPVAFGISVTTRLQRIYECYDFICACNEENIVVNMSMSKGTAWRIGAILLVS